MPTHHPLQHRRATSRSRAVRAGLFAMFCVGILATLTWAEPPMPVGLPDRIVEPRVLVDLAQVRGNVADALSEAPEQVPAAIDVPASLAALLCRVPDEMLRAAGRAGCLAVGEGTFLLDEVRRIQAHPLPSAATALPGL